MGRETTCRCEWGRESGSCKVLLESSDLILRGAIRRTVSLDSLTQFQVQGDQLIFRAHDELVTLFLGAKMAESWARKIRKPPPSLASKLGIAAATRLLLLGALVPPEISDVAQSATLDTEQPAVVIAAIKAAADLQQALLTYEGLPDNPPLWIVYAKGSGHAVGESVIRATLRAAGFMDTKVASVSAVFTALKFVRRG